MVTYQWGRGRAWFDGWINHWNVVVISEVGGGGAELREGNERLKKSLGSGGQPREGSQGMSQEGEQVDVMIWRRGL